MPTSSLALSTRIKELNSIGVALSTEKNEAKLLELILTSARNLTGADAGTLYKVNAKEECLEFEIVHNDQLNIYLGGSGEPISANFNPVPLYLDDLQAGKPVPNERMPNERMIVAWSVLHKKTVRLADAYNEAGFDFSGTKAFDAKTGYRSKSFLTVPLLNHEGEVIAALQLLNKTCPNSQETLEFDAEDQDIAESLASQAAIALTNRCLIDELRNLFDSFTRVIASAIDSKSPHTGAHCRRVPEITLLLAEAANGLDFPGLEGFSLTDDDRYEIKTAAWLHDCGKIVTPHHVMEKATKLEGLFDRLGWVEDKFELAIKDVQLAKLEAELAAAKAGKSLSQAELNHFAQQEAALKEDLAFVQSANTGSEFMRDEDLARIENLATTTWRTHTGEVKPLLTSEEVANLSIRRGTLNTEERQIMEDHMQHTINMLKQLPFPKNLQRVPEYAGGHHERMDGKGYPLGLTKEQLSIPARIMALADVFEALTAHERPYKKPMPVSMALSIMGRMAAEGHLDPDLFTLFVYKKVYLAYAEANLKPEQLDELDTSQLAGLNLAAIEAMQLRHKQ